MPPFWAVYVTVAGVDDMLSKVKSAGGTVVMGPMDVFDAGRMAVIQDPGGAYVSMWEPGQQIGAQLVNEPGTFTWSELSTFDLPAAKKFYVSVFGWGLETASSDSGAAFTVAGRVVCGAHRAGEGEFPAWSAWFAVEDCDKSAAVVSELGGSILMSPTDMDFGRGAVVANPHGAVFGIGVMSAVAAATTR